ncbi:hypothetical protein OG21DRAFT_1489207 [Imleria badia]|nr:hypothetical protein OG21DRAFT_1489207 [Imleria badia]
MTSGIKVTPPVRPVQSLGARKRFALSPDPHASSPPSPALTTTPTPTRNGSRRQLPDGPQCFAVKTSTTIHAVESHDIIKEVRLLAAVSHPNIVSLIKHEPPYAMHALLARRAPPVLSILPASHPLIRTHHLDLTPARDAIRHPGQVDHLPGPRWHGLPPLRTHPNRTSRRRDGQTHIHRLATFARGAPLLLLFPLLFRLNWTTASVASGSRNWWQENLRLVSVPPHALMRAAKILTMSQPRRSSIHPTLPYFTLGWSATLAFAAARRTQAKADASQGKTSPTQVTPRRDCGAGFSNFSTSSHPIHVCYLNSDEPRAHPAQ